MSLYTFARNTQNKVELDDAGAYVDSAQAFQRFADTVTIQSGSGFSWSMYSRESENIKFLKALKLGVQNLGVKVIRPLKIICLKLFTAGKDIQNIHTQFLSLVIRFKVYKEAIDILDYRKLQKKLDSNLIRFYYYALIINFELQRIHETQQTLSIALDIFKPLTLKQEMLECIKTFVFINLIIDSSNNLQNTMKLNDLIDMGKQYYSSYSMLLDQRSTQQKLLEITLIQQLLKTGVRLAPEKQQYLVKTSSSLLRKYYAMINYKAVKLRSKVRQDISLHYQRVKQTDIQDSNLDSLETMQQINKFGILARYSCSQKILYFNHERYSPSDIDNMVSKCYFMYEIIKKQKQLENKSLQSEKDRRMGSLTGMRMMM